MKQKIFNLIILDESGSMSGVTKQTIDGCNETINTVKAAAKQFAETQEHFISIFAFQSNPSVPSRYLIKNETPEKVKHIGTNDYQPSGCTPLNDAIGSCLTDLKVGTKNEPTAIGSVTIITDGYENSSEHYTLEQVAKMIEQLKELGWNFNFIGANIDVQRTSRSYNIENCMEFEQSTEGTRAMFHRERESKMAYLRRMERERETCCPTSADEIRELNKRAARGYYESDGEKPKFTPERISYLNSNEIFVFGSDILGNHGGGAAQMAVLRFGANVGQAVGLQGQSYAIPTVGVDLKHIAKDVEIFTNFAKNNRHLTFYVTRIGCGVAGFSDAEIAPLFVDALPMENVILPKSFADEINEK